MKRILVGALVVVLALGLVGCEGTGEKVDEKAGGVEADGDSVTIETEDGAVTVEGDTGKIPEDFPADFPLYDGARANSTSSVAADGDVTYYIDLVTEDQVIDVYDWYKGEFTSGNWEIKSDVKMPGDDGDTAMLNVEKDSMKGTVTVTVGDAGTEIGIILVVEG